MDLKNINGWQVLIGFATGLGGAAAKELFPSHPWLVPLFIGLALSFVALGVVKPDRATVRMALIAGGPGIAFATPPIWRWVGPIFSFNVPVWLALSAGALICLATVLVVYRVLRPRLLGGGDKKLLEEFATVFSGKKMHLFITTLEDSWCIYMEQMQDFEDAVRLYRLGHKRFRQLDMEKAKNRLLNSISDFESFTLARFNSIDSHRAKFYGGVSEFDMMTTHANTYPDEEKQLIALAREVNNAWKAIVHIAEDMDTEYRWPD